jgi:hypothetical protein
MYQCSLLAHVFKMNRLLHIHFGMLVVV